METAYLLLICMHEYFCVDQFHNQEKNTNKNKEN